MPWKRVSAAPLADKAEERGHQVPCPFVQLTRPCRFPTAHLQEDTRGCGRTSSAVAVVWDAGEYAQGIVIPHCDDYGAIGAHGPSWQLQDGGRERDGSEQGYPKRQASGGEHSQRTKQYLPQLQGFSVFGPVDKEQRRVGPIRTPDCALHPYWKEGLGRHFANLRRICGRQEDAAESEGDVRQQGHPSPFALSCPSFWLLGSWTYILSRGH